MRTSAAPGQVTAVRTCRRQLRNLVGAALALQPGLRPRDVAPILARQACQALGARQAVASIVGAGDSPDVPFRAIAGDARLLSEDHLRLLEQAEGGVGGLRSMVDPATRAVVAVASSIDDRHGRPVGALMVADGHSGAFREDDIAVLGGLTHIASLTLDIASLQESIQAGRAAGPATLRPVASEAASEFIDLLTVILGHAGLLGATLAESDDRCVDVAAIATAAQRASRIAAQLMATNGQA